MNSVCRQRTVAQVRGSSSTLFCPLTVGVYSSGDGGTCAADAVPDPACLVWGVVYDITDSDRQQLDAREGAGLRTYRPKEVLVHPHGDSEQRVIVLTYAPAMPRRCNCHLVVNASILSYVARGDGEFPPTI